MIDSPYMRVDKVAEYIGVSQTTIYRWVSDYGFPKPVKIGGDSMSACSIWSRKMIDEWFDKMAKQQSGETKK